MGRVRRSVDESFRRLAIGDPGVIGELSDPDHHGSGLPRLDERTECLLRLGALIALDAPQMPYVAAVAAAQRAGASTDDMLAVLVAVAGAVGSVRIIAAAPRIALAAGYDVDAALERNDPIDHRAPPA